MYTHNWNFNRQILQGLLAYDLVLFSSLILMMTGLVWLLVQPSAQSDCIYSRAFKLFTQTFVGFRPVKPVAPYRRPIQNEIERYEVSHRRRGVTLLNALHSTHSVVGSIYTFHFFIGRFNEFGGHSLGNKFVRVVLYDEGAICRLNFIG
jgi:hypothetical protein